MNETRKLFNLQHENASLNFEELYFQFFVKINPRLFMAWPLTNEAHLSKGYLIEFNQSWNLIGSQQISDLAPGTMRPTPVVLDLPDKGISVLLCGGRSDRSSQLYSTNSGKWLLTPKLPVGHSLTTFVAVNYRDSAVFTFCQDSLMTIQSAFLDLNTAQWTSHTTENMKEMDWAAQIPASAHKLQSLLLKTAVCLPNGTIVLVAQGSKEGMPAEIGGLLLHFKVSRAGDKFTLSLNQTQFFFPSIVPRLLDQAHVVGDDKLVVVQDVGDDSERFEAYLIDLGKKRTGTVYQKHKRFGYNLA